MKITHVTTRVLRTPADNPLVVGLPAPSDTREFVTLERSNPARGGHMAGRRNPVTDVREIVRRLAVLGPAPRAH